MQYEEDDMLMLSGIQHFAFCPRQWALIHIDQQWEDNRLTIEGLILHRHVDDSFYRQKMNNVICLRSVSIASKKLGLYGLSDVVELHPTDSSVNAITHPSYSGFWLPYPIEYKHGKPKCDHIDIVQLAAQAMCLEEQYCIEISDGAIFYAEPHRREVIRFTDAIREEVKHLSSAMHRIYADGLIPKAVKRPQCRSCSLMKLCMPKTTICKSASNYIKMKLYEETS